jgi:Reverse transcriptase (RNA-dependent DNA polymerase)
MVTKARFSFTDRACDKILSPMLFILTIETLQMLIANVQDDLIQTPDSKNELLQFANDTIILTPTHPQNLTTIMGVLRNFVALSGVHLNQSKSGYVPIAIPYRIIDMIMALLGCQPLQLPITYLGLPLTHLKPTKGLYDPLILSLQRRLQSLDISHLSMAGKAVIINSILNALSMYYM